jgi:hypothetical protein
MAQFTPESARQTYGGVVMDSITSKLAGGAGMFGSFVDPEGVNRQGIDARVAIAYPVADIVFLGLTGRYLRITQDGMGPFGDSPVSGGLKNEDGTRGTLLDTLTFDAGITVRAADGLYLSALGQNLTTLGGGIAPAMVGGGIGYAQREFSFEFDGVADLQSWGAPTARVMGGGEYLIAGRVPLRLGYRYDQGIDMHFASAGLGYLSKEFSVEASVRRGIAETAPTTFMVSAAYFLESSGLVTPQQPRAPAPSTQSMGQ